MFVRGSLRLGLSVGRCFYCLIRMQGWPPCLWYNAILIAVSVDTHMVPRGVLTRVDSLGRLGWARDTT